MTIPERWQTGMQGRELTSMKIGGPIQYFSKPKTLEELREDLQIAKEQGLPVTCLGGGSNLIMADRGFRGLLIRPQFTQLTVLSESGSEPYQPYLEELRAKEAAAPRYARGEEAGVLALERGTEARSGKTVLVEMGAGVAWGQAVMWSLQQNLAGLHWYARIPSQVGGAVFNNIHGEKHLLSEVICAVHALDRETGEERIFGPGDLAFGYDQSRFHRRGEIVTRVIFALTEVSPDASAEKQLYLDWTTAKSKVQPSGANCGSVFQNITPEQAREAGQTPLAAGWYVDQAGMKGEQVGGLQVYPGHANFIINHGDGTQADFIALVNRIRQRVKEKFGILLEPEAECIDEQGVRLSW